MDSCMPEYLIFPILLATDILFLKGMAQRTALIEKQLAKNFTIVGVGLEANYLEPNSKSETCLTVSK